MVSRVASTLVAENHVPKDWLLHVHPQGWIYFYNPSLKIVIDQDVRILEVYEIVQKAIQLNPSDADSQEMETHMQVTQELQASGAGVGVLSLVIDHLNCIASYEWEDVKCFEDLQTDLRVLNRRRRLYWNYLWNHPSHVLLPSRALPEARDALLWYTTDNLISGKRSVVPFSKAECDGLGKVLKDLSDPSYDSSSAKTVFVSWFLREVCSFRDSEQYGTLTPKQSVALRQELKSKNSSPNIARPPAAILPLLNVLIRIFFFGIPLIYLSHVRKSSEYRGRLANVQQNWEHYIERLVREYAHFLLISTVLLSATVGLLSVSDILQPAKTAAIVSALASLGSIIVGVVAIWRHQASTRTADSFTYMYNAQHNYLGYHGHAMILSLPPVLLVWAVVTFTAAILAYAMQEVDASDSPDRLSAWMVLSLFLVFLFLVFAALYTFSGLWRFQQRARISRGPGMSITSVFQRVRQKPKTSEDVELA
ncbi:hypothetical protein C8F04DRAFT_1059072 [Mycena alexandri]|uniref:Uncharacterized protein n=1 Tax=Mycena alexandri TaxID=1745969 RepID=A0AAD6XCM4_9AGAR|nr:hypothetical protein C8F04DRAFT_1059072 [Mycena alexandri]